MLQIRQRRDLDVGDAKYRGERKGVAFRRGVCGHHTKPLLIMRRVDAVVGRRTA